MIKKAVKKKITNSNKLGAIIVDYFAIIIISVPSLTAAFIRKVHDMVLGAE